MSSFYGDEDLDTRIQLHQLADSMVNKFADHLKDRFRTHMAEEHGVYDEEELQKHMEQFLDADEIARAKHYVKMLIPDESPTTVLLVMFSLSGVMATASMHNAMRELAEDPEAMAEAIDHLRSTDESEEIISRINDKHKRKAEHYKNVDINGVQMKVADLGDVSDTINLN